MSTEKTLLMTGVKENLKEISYKLVWRKLEKSTIYFDMKDPVFSSNVEIAGFTLNIYWGRHNQVYTAI